MPDAMEIRHHTKSDGSFWIQQYRWIWRQYPDKSYWTWVDVYELPSFTETDEGGGS